MPHTEWRAAVDSWACCGHVLHTFLQIGSVPVRRRRNDDDDDDDDDDPPPADPSVAFAVFSSCVGTKCRARARMTPRPLILEIMGGKGAKERRRLERLAAQKASSEEKSVGRPKDEWKPKRQNKQNQKRVRQFKTDRIDDAKKPFVAKKKKKAEKKFKKPKHLKRKLAQLSNSDEVEREKLVAEMKKLEERKSLFSKNKPRGKKQRGGDRTVPEATPKPVNAVALDSAVVSSDSDAETRASNNRDTKVGPDLSRRKDDVSLRLKTTSEVKSSDVSAGPNSDRNAERQDSNRERSDQKSDVSLQPRTDVFEAETDSVSSDSDTAEAENGKSGKQREKRAEEGSQARSEEEKGKAEPKSRRDGDASDTDDSDSDDDELERPSRRQRGRGRKGRETTEQIIQAQVTLTDTVQNTQVGPNAVSDQNTKTVSEAKLLRQQEKQKDTRRCIGRKPVTDFVIGEKYPGKVVYMKPFGVFIDIMCHSDAFCHVSRIQDDYIKSPEEVLKIDDEVMARVVEIHRRQKRITVSLQSDSRIEDEKASLEARQHRLERRESKKKRKRDGYGDEEAQQKGEEPASAEMEPEPLVPSPAPTNKLVDEDGNYLKAESDMTPAELKRARKLARRAARRAEKVNDD